ncbi:hypothetical protein [Gordonia sp. (in: high G+C Gram-positive bacteria)]|uniref:hypothetical protein n=1 Tax=Gordonia sp. (in: high G+C Gram-positive bacteria) TaxID=84139 RepID=UPI00333F3BE8
MTAPAELKVKHCSRCGVEIVWARNERGRWMPLDRVAAANGRYDLQFSGGPSARFLPFDDASALRRRGGMTFDNHFKTCTKRGQKK